MAEYLTIEQILGVPQAAQKTPEGGGEYLTFEQATGVQAPLSFWERLKKGYAETSAITQPIKETSEKGLQQVGAEARAIGNMFVGLPGGVAGVGMDILSRISSLMYGDSPKVAGQKARAVSDQVNQDWGKITSALGLHQDAKGSKIDQLMQWAMETSDAGGERLEQATQGVLTLDTTRSVRDALLNGLGVRGLTHVKARPSAIAEVFEKKPAVEPAPVITPKTSAVDVQAIVDSAIASRSPLETFWAAKVPKETAADLAWRQTVAGLVEKTPKIAPDLPTEGPGITPKTRLAEPTVIGEPVQLLDQALAKLRQGLLITKEEAKAVRSLTPRPGEGVIVDSQGRSVYQRGAVDPTLLKVLGIMGFGAVAAKGLYDWYNSSGVSEDTMRDVGLGLGALGAAGVMKAEAFTKLNPAFAETVLKTPAGEIAPLYHGGKALEEGMPSRGTGRMGEGLYLTDSTKRASGFGREGSVYPIYANLRNPIAAETFAERFGLGIKTPAEAKRITEQLRQEGYDGVVDKVGDRYNEVVVFEPKTNIRSAISGQVDQKLLAGLATGAGLAAYALSDGEKDPLTLAAAGLAGTMTLSKSRFAEMKTPELVKTFHESTGRTQELAAAQIYENTHRQLTKSVQSWGRDLPVEDIVQQTYEKAFRALKREPWREDAALSTWLYAIAKNEMREIYTAPAARAARQEVPPTIDPETQTAVLPEKAMLEQSPELYQSVEDIAARNDLARRMQDALNALPEYYRQPFVMSELEGKTIAQIAQELGRPAGTVSAQIARAHSQLQHQLRDYRDLQAGKASPEMLAALAGIGGGALIGNLVDTERPLRSALYGALAGGVLATAAGRGALKAAIKSPDAALGLISTRLGNIAPELRRMQRDHERVILGNVDRANDIVLPFLQALKKVPKELQLTVERALLNGDVSSILKIPELAKSYTPVRELLANFETQLRGLGRFSEGLTNYFPRLVEDFEGLKTALGQEAAQGLEKRLVNAEADMYRKQKRSLTEVERSIVTNNYLFTPDPGSFLPGYAKARGLREVPPELQRFYAPPAESLLRYVSGAVTDIATAKFFGKDLVTRRDGGRSYTDIDGSIGGLIARLSQAGKLSSEQAVELRDILKARFEGGEQAMNPVLAAVRNLTNAGLLGNIYSAATQLGDSIMTIYHHGAVPTLQAVAAKFLGQSRVTAKQFGLINHVAEELADMHWSGKLVHQTMKWSGFHAIDMFAKGLNLNAALFKAERQLASPKGEAQFRAKYETAYGADFATLVADLKARRISDLTESYLFSELSDIQPVSKAEMPQAYLENPNGRFLYQLKTYMLKQIDVVRRDAYQEIAKGTPEGIARGVKNLGALGAVYAVANVPGDVVKAWLTGQDVDVLSTPKLVENVGQAFGLNRYTTLQLGQGKIVETALGMATPPVRVLQDIVQGKEKAVGYIPFAGKVLEARYFGGNERKEIYETRLANAGKPPEERKPLSPEARKYLLEHRKKKEITQ